MNKLEKLNFGEEISLLGLKWKCIIPYKTESGRGSYAIIASRADNIIYTITYFHDDRKLIFDRTFIEENKNYFNAVNASLRVAA